MLIFFLNICNTVPVPAGGGVDEPPVQPAQGGGQPQPASTPAAPAVNRYTVQKVIKISQI